MLSIVPATTIRSVHAGCSAPTTVGKNATGEIGQAESVVEFPIPKQASAGGDAAAVKFQMQSPVKIDPQRSIIRFTH
jgi:hypothetical protein